MNCILCGNQLSQNDKFCAKCGNPVTEQAQLKSASLNKSGSKSKRTGGFLSEIMDAARELLKNPKKLIPTFVLAGVWIVFSLMSGFGANLPILRFLYTLTYANGGMFGGFFGGVGGIFGKAIFAAVVNSIVLSVCEKKNPFTGVGKSLGKTFGQAAFSGISAVAPFLIGSGVGVILYWFFNITSSPVNCAVAVAGAVGALLAVGQQKGLLFSLVFGLAGRLSHGKAPSQIVVSRVITGFSVGFALGLPLTFARFGWLLFLVGALFLAVGIILSVIGKNGTKKMAATTAMFLVVVAALSPAAFAESESGQCFPFERYANKRIVINFGEMTQESSLRDAGETELMINGDIYVFAYENNDMIASQSASLTIKKIPGMYEARLGEYPHFFYDVSFCDEEKKDDLLKLWNDRLEWGKETNGIRNEDGDLYTETLFNRGHKIVIDQYAECFTYEKMESKGYCYDCIWPVCEVPGLYLFIRYQLMDSVNLSHPEMDSAEFDRLYDLGQQLLDTDYVIKWRDDLEIVNDGERVVLMANLFSPNDSKDSPDTGDDMEDHYIPYHGRLTYTNGAVNKHGQPFPDLMDFDRDGDIDYADRVIQYKLVHNPNVLDLPNSAVGIVLVSLLTAFLGGAGAIVGSVVGSVLGTAASAAGSMLGSTASAAGSMLGSASANAAGGIADALKNLSSPDAGGSEKEDLGPYITRDSDGDLEVTDPATGERRIYVAQDDGTYRNPLTNAVYTQDELKDSLLSRSERADQIRQDQATARAAVSSQRAENAKLSQGTREYEEEKARTQAETEKEIKLHNLWLRHGGEEGDEASIRAAMARNQAQAEAVAAVRADHARHLDNLTKTAEYTVVAADVGVDVLAELTGPVGKSIKTAYTVGKNTASRLSDAVVNDKELTGAIAMAGFDSLADITQDALEQTGWHITGNVGSEVFKNGMNNLYEGKDFTDGMGEAAVMGTIKGTVAKVASAISSSGAHTEQTLKNDLKLIRYTEHSVYPPKSVEPLCQMRMLSYFSNVKADRVFNAGVAGAADVTKLTAEGIKDAYKNIDQQFGNKKE